MLVTSEQLGPTQYFTRLSVNSNKVTKLVHPLATYIHGVKCHVLMYSYQMKMLVFLKCNNYSNTTCNMICIPTALFFFFLFHALYPQSTKKHW